MSFLPRTRGARAAERRALLAVLAVCVLGTLVLAAAMPRLAGAQTSERIRSYDVTLKVDADGVLEVTEVITYDFGSNQRHGILRDIPVRLHYDDTYDRRFDLDVLEVSSETAPDQYKREDAGGGVTRLRIGDPDETITGEHTYVIRYSVEGALNGFADHDELYWNATGNGWPAPIDTATVTVEMPAEIQDSICFAGPYGSSALCDDSFANGSTMTGFSSGLRSYEGVTVVASIPTGIVPTPEPLLVERWSLSRAFTFSPFTIGTTAILGLLVAGGVWRTLWVVGRDRQWAGSLVDARFGTLSGETERVPLSGGGPDPVEYTPPDGLRPGLIGALRDEVAHPLDATATIVDLATRGYLRIEETKESGFLKDKTDWNLVRITPAPAGSLRPYEQKLLDALFEDGDEVELSSLRNKFHARLKEVQDLLYEEMVAQGWYPRSPQRTRSIWLGVGLFVLVASIGLFVLAIMKTHWALIPIPLMVGGLVITIGHYLAPSRTAKGSAMLRRVRGFERFIADAEVHRSRFAEQARIFYDYLPYAIVFGLTEEWAKAFEGLADLPEADWYSGATGHFAAMSLADNMTRFSQESSGVIASTPGGSGSSGGGGFSGGGGGGGGGGSW